jgi:hypothetical protein
MNRAIDIIRKPRLTMLNAITELTTEELNKIPEGFNNNIIWNLGHMIASQQGISYKRSGLNAVVTDEFFDTYKSGTKPVKFVDTDEIAFIKEQMLTTLDQFEADIEKGIFVDYTSVVTRYNVELASINDAISFLPFHDGFHIGYVMALRRVVSSPVTM